LAEWNKINEESIGWLVKILKKTVDIGRTGEKLLFVDKSSRLVFSKDGLPTNIAVGLDCPLCVAKINNTWRIDMIAFAEPKLIERLRRQGFGTGEISINGRIYTKKKTDECAIEVSIQVEQSGAEFKRREIFIDSCINGILKSGQGFKRIYICGVQIQRDQQTGLERCSISLKRLHKKKTEKKQGITFQQKISDLNLYSPGND